MSAPRRLVLPTVGLVAAALLCAAAVGVWAVSRPGVAPPAALAAPRFVEEAARAGIDHAYQGEWNYFVGGGVAVFDCNEDQKPDLYFAGGAYPAALYRNESPIEGAFRFTGIPDAATDMTSVTGAYPIDIDSDFQTDLAVLRLGENVLLRGLGGCRFERANETWGVDGGRDWTVGFSATWEDGEQMPTLAFGDYVALDAWGRSAGGCSDSDLVRPSLAGTGYGPAIPLTPGHCALSALFSDWSRSGQADLRLTNDRHYDRNGEEQLWRVAHGERPRLYTREEGWAKLQIWGMGIASHDLTGDGLSEVFLTSQGDNKLQTLGESASRPSYRDIAIRRGVTAHRPFTGGDVMPSTAWHAEFDDVNSDGFVDLFVTKGNVEAMPEYAARDPSNLLLGQPDGTFAESAVQAGIVSYARGRGGAVADLNLDGLLDLVKVNRLANVELWRNVGAGSAEQPLPMGDWIALRVQQRAANGNATGAWLQVEVNGRTVERELTVGGGHASGDLGWIHFGLGSAEHARVRVMWPDGARDPWSSVAANRFWAINRGEAAPAEWTRR